MNFIYVQNLFFQILKLTKNGFFINKYDALVLLR